MSQSVSQPRSETAGAPARTTVVNLKGHRDDPHYADVVYVGRPMHRGGWRLEGSPLASPYRPGRDGTREEVLEKYREHLLGREDLLALLPALRGRRLGCWCVPEPCHAQVVAELAEAGAGAAAGDGDGSGEAEGDGPGPDTVTP